MADITVTLPRTYISRNVTLTIVKAIPLRQRLWEIRARDAQGCSFGPTRISVDGVRPPVFQRKKDAVAWLQQLNPPPRIWAIPEELAAQIPQEFRP